MSSHYSKSVHSVRSHPESEVESWGTVHTGSRTPTPTHNRWHSTYASLPPSQNVGPSAFSHQSNPSYPSPHYGPSTPSTPCADPSFRGYPFTPAAPCLSSVPLPAHTGTPYISRAPPNLPTDIKINPVLTYPPKAVFNVTLSCSAIAVHGSASLSHTAFDPPVAHLTLGLSFLMPGKKISVRPSSNHGVTARDVFNALSIYLLTEITAHDLARVPFEVVESARSAQRMRRRHHDLSGLKWVDFLGQFVYFGGLFRNAEGIYEVQFLEKPLPQWQ